MTNDKPFRDALRLEINRKDADKLRRVARALIEKAMDGDVSAIKEVADRLDGRVPQLVGGDRKTLCNFKGLSVSLCRSSAMSRRR